MIKHSFLVIFFFLTAVVWTPFEIFLIVFCQLDKMTDKGIYIIRQIRYHWITFKRIKNKKWIDRSKINKRST
jgi:hypothetical protein